MDDSDGEDNQYQLEGGGRVLIEEDDTDEEEQQFDIALAASHSYMGPGLVAISGRAVLEAGWEGRIPVVAHHGTVFPGETVPMLLPNPDDAAVLARVIKQDKLFGLLCPDESGALVSGYGVLCEVFEAGLSAEQEAPLSLTFKARATHRFRLKDMPKRPLPIQMYSGMKFVEVVVLAEVALQEPLRQARLASLDPHRRGQTQGDRVVRRADAALTPWPLFVYEMHEYGRMREQIAAHFAALRLPRLPEDPVSLSFFVASNLPLSPKDRLALFVVDNALLRLHMEVRFITRKSVLCCSSCGAEIARRDDIFAMSSDGVHSNYTNPGGYMHDIVTVSRCGDVAPSGAPSAEYSWFPGYAWTIVVCRTCTSHIGWRFDAMKRNLRPQLFFGLCRNYVQPRHEGDEPPSLDHLL